MRTPIKTRNENPDRYDIGHCEPCDDYVPVSIDEETREFYCKKCLGDIYLDGKHKL